MPAVVIARHLFTFFPGLRDRDLQVPGETVAEVIQEVDRLAPGFADYVLDERGALRMHVNAFVGQEAVVDREALSDPVPPEATVHIFQALSGG